MSTTDIDVLRHALEWTKAQKNVVLATVIETWGSAPRKAGSHMAVREDGVFLGSVSGGCVEGAIVREAQNGDWSTGGRLLEYGISNESAWEVGLACGGKLSIWLEEIDSSVLESICSHHEDRLFCCLHIPISNGGRSFVAKEEVGQGSAKSIIQKDGRAIRVYYPARRMFLIGAAHIAQALTAMAVVVGYEIIVIDPRGLFLHPDRWGDAQTLEVYPDEYFSQITIHARDAIVVLSHDPKIDDPALLCALSSSAYYIGALGSRKTHGQRVQRLQKKG